MIEGRVEWADCKRVSKPGAEPLEGTSRFFLQQYSNPLQVFLLGQRLHIIGEMYSLLMTKYHWDSPLWCLEIQSSCVCVNILESPKYQESQGEFLNIWTSSREFACYFIFPPVIILLVGSSFLTLYLFSDKLQWAIKEKKLLHLLC